MTVCRRHCWGSGLELGVRSKEVSLGLFEFLRALLLDIFLVQIKLDSSRVRSNLAMESPSSWLSAEHGRDIDFIGGLGELAEKRGQRVGASLACVERVLLLGSRAWSRSGS